ncbi:apolipophorin-III-like protein [Anoplolepis gracilipes]|uniref:apolipophorin-III-like protein n=1 Tax=Anoplolepis gracilipes TaxID=354296 RepID=UPI003B9F170E
MKCLVSFILAVFLIAAEGKVVPASNVENQQTTTDSLESALANRIQEAKAAISNFGTQIQEHLPNLPKQDEILNTFREQSSNFVNNLNEYIKNVTEEVKTKNPELENIWTDLKSKLSEAVDKLNINSETTEQINQLGTKFQEGVQTIVTESEKTAKAISENSAKVQEGIAKLTKQAIDIAVTASQNLNNQLQQATTPQP